MKPRAVALVAGVAVAVMVAATAYYLLTSIDAIVERAIERYGSEATGTAVRVASVDISLSSGRGTVRGLTVANPDGFSRDSAFRMEEITLQIDIGTVASSPVVIDEIRIGAPVVLFEVNGAGAANVDVIRKNAARGEAPKAPEAPEAPEEQGEPLRLLIRQLSVTGGEIHVDTTAVGGKEAKVELPPLAQSQVGGPRGGTPGEIGKIVVDALTRQVAAAVAARQVGSYLEKKIDEKLEGEAGEAAKGLLRSLTE